jgi:hypothetical protein
MRRRRGTSSPFPFRAAGHYNEHGHRLVAQTVLATIDPRSGAAR